MLGFSVLATRGPALEETARSLGAGPLDVFRRVTWPVLWRGLLPGVIAVFAFVAGSYEAAVLLAPSDPLALPLLTFERYTDPDLARRPDAFVLVLVGLATSAAAVAVARMGPEPLGAVRSVTAGARRALLLVLLALGAAGPLALLRSGRAPAPGCAPTTRAGSRSPSRPCPRSSTGPGPACPPAPTPPPCSSTT